MLSDELTRGISDLDIVDEDNIGDDWEKWLPDPVDANPGTCVRMHWCSQRSQTWLCGVVAPCYQGATTPRSKV